MANSAAANTDDDKYADRRVTPRYKIHWEGILHCEDEKFPVIIKDITIYGMGIAPRGGGALRVFEKHQRVFVEWERGQMIHADVMWSFKGHHGLLLTPVLEEDHPLIVKAKAEAS